MMVSTMNTKHASAVLIALIAFGSFLGVASLLSDDASAASLSGTWVSRVSGQGYTQTYMGPTGSTITDHLDVELVLSSSGSGYSGTMTATGTGGTKTYTVEGTFDGTTFLMTAHYGWDGVNYLNPVYTLTVSGNEMSGSATYLNVGVPIHGTFDLKKSGAFGSIGFTGSTTTTAVLVVVVVIAVVSIGVASTPVKIPTQGFQPGVTHVPSPPSQYQPSWQGETGEMAPPVGPDGAVPQGGAGLQYATPAPVGKPLPPRQHYGKVSQEAPRCPNHPGVALMPHYTSADGSDPGSWYCPQCKLYPWGRN